MKNVVARGRASSNRASYGGAGLCAGWEEPPSSVAGVKQSETEEAGARTGVEVRRTGWEEVGDMTSADTDRKSVQDGTFARTGDDSDQLTFTAVVDEVTLPSCLLLCDWLRG